MAEKKKAETPAEKKKRQAREANKKRSGILKGIKKAATKAKNWFTGASPGKYEKAWKDHMATQKEKERIAKELEK